MRAKRPDFFALLTLFVCVGVAVTTIVQAAESDEAWPGLRLSIEPVAWTDHTRLQAAPPAAVLSVTRGRQAGQLPSWASWLVGGELQFGLLTATKTEPAWYQRLDQAARQFDFNEVWTVRPVDISYVRVNPADTGFGVTLGIATDSEQAEEPKPTLFFSITNQW